MTNTDQQNKNTELINADAEAIRYLEQEIRCGKHWYVALLEAIRLWRSPEEVVEDRIYRYLIACEAFDWLLLAERLCSAVNGLISEKEKEDLLFRGKPPLNFTPDQVTALVGQSKYTQYLNYFYGITVEQALLLQAEEEVQKERQPVALNNQKDAAAEAFERIYDSPRAVLLKAFRKEKGYPQLKSTELSEQKEFTYWLFKYRVKHCDKARVASDTKKALEYLKRYWEKRGIAGALISDIC